MKHMAMQVPQLDHALARPPRGERPRVRLFALLRWCRRTDLATVRAAVWALRACRRLHSAREVRGLHAPRLPRVPRVRARAIRGVEHVLWLRSERCLVRASVCQAWLAAHGEAQDVVIGVAVDPRDGLRAHAWLANEPGEGAGYDEIARVAPPRLA